MQTTPESWRRIVEELNNPAQQRIVSDEREQTNVLVLAGPGSGKTRVLVHRIAYLVRVRRENPRGILALAYNRHAAVEIRRRLVSLIGDDAKAVTVLTCHALAMRMVGASLVGRGTDADTFDDILRQAIALLKGEGLAPDEADAQRDQLLAGFRWILVDEYQDVGPEQYELISALAGRTLNDPDGRLSLFAVGDDDQNIYAFAGASVEYIRRFEQDYAARPSYLTENYRSARNIVLGANQVIEVAADRMKVDHPITVDRARDKAPAGGSWEALDPVSKGRVQILRSGSSPIDQAIVAMKELERKSALDRVWDWSNVAVIAREWKFLEPVRSYCEREGIPVQMADEQPPPMWRLRETHRLMDWLESRGAQFVGIASIREWLHSQGPGHWWEQLEAVVEALSLEAGEADIPVKHFVEWLVEWGREIRRQQTGLLLLTAHRAKGLEFDHVAVLDGGWEKIGRGEDRDASRRLYYVAMSRAKRTLSLLRRPTPHPFLDGLDANTAPFIESGSHGAVEHDQTGLGRRYLRLTLKDVDIGFAGRHACDHAIHAAIAALKSGDSLQLQGHAGRWDLLDGQGRLVGRLAKSFTPPKGLSLESIRVTAIIQRHRRDSAAEYQSSIRCDQWEVVLPELVYGD